MKKTDNSIQQGRKPYTKAECEIVEIESRLSLLAQSTGTGAVVPGFEWEEES